MQRVVARYAGLLDRAERGDRRAWPEVRQMEDRLGLNPAAILRLRWQIDDDRADQRHASRVASLQVYRDVT